MIIVQLTYKAQKWRIQNRYLNILDHTERPALPNSTLPTVDDWCIWIIAEIVNKNFKKIAYMKLFDMWPSALVGWNNIHFHDLNAWSSCTMPGSHIPVCKQKSINHLHISNSLLMLFLQRVVRTVHNPPTLWPQNIGVWPLSKARIRLEEIFQIGGKSGTFWCCIHFVDYMQMC